MSTCTAAAAIASKNENSVPTLNVENSEASILAALQNWHKRNGHIEKKRIQLYDSSTDT